MREEEEKREKGEEKGGMTGRGTEKTGQREKRVGRREGEREEMKITGNKGQLLERERKVTGRNEGREEEGKQGRKRDLGTQDNHREDMFNLHRRNLGLWVSWWLT